MRILINVVNRFSPRPIMERNVVGEIRGKDHPEEIVLISAHLDSWGLGTGATDDGFGVASALAAAEGIIRSGLRPQRTIRFVLFTGEEQGLLGSRAYVRDHAGELQQIRVTLALDWGAGRILGFPTAGHTELIPVFARLNQLAPEMHLDPPGDGWLFMTDAYAFTLAGVPGIAPVVRDPGYSERAHSAGDTLDKIQASDLRQSATVLAVTGFFLADTPELPTIRFSTNQVAASLLTGKQQPMLKALGLWPF